MLTDMCVMCLSACKFVVMGVVFVVMVSNIVKFPLVFPERTIDGYIVRSSVPNPEVEFIALPCKRYGEQPRLHIDKRLSEDAMTFASVMSAWDRADTGTTVFIYMYPTDIRVEGASLGLASFLCLANFRVPSNVLVTGYVMCFGNEPCDFDDIGVQTVMGVSDKIEHARQTNQRLIVNPASQGYYKSESAIPCTCMREVMKIIK